MKLLYIILLFCLSTAEGIEVMSNRERWMHCIKRCAVYISLYAFYLGRSRIENTVFEPQRAMAGCKRENLPDWVDVNIEIPICNTLREIGPNVLKDANVKRIVENWFPIGNRSTDEIYPEAQHVCKIGCIAAMPFQRR
ncbi:hypothetical protein ANCCAN_02541 [Ancylostoma caninum]|uniref:Uncharacterized protein n=1 Tax=Ancylostoma caninum TaxID=29170 RepID=A0A368H6L9_ANCCA|nr:hypothetical protein ANCCAN_02541 [Ancylostoma caninum]